MALDVNELAAAGFSVETLRLPLAALGIFGLLAGLGAWLVQGDFGLMPRILLAAGVLLLGIYVALDPEDVWTQAHRPQRARTRATRWPSPLAAIVILGLFNVARLALSDEARPDRQPAVHAVGSERRSSRRRCPQPVKVTAFLTRQRLAQAGLPDAAERLPESLGRQADLRVHRSRAAPGRRAWRPALPPPARSSIRWATRSRTARARPNKTSTRPWSSSSGPRRRSYFTTGHGERSLDGFGPQDYGTIKQGLDRATTSRPRRSIWSPRARCPTMPPKSSSPGRPIPSFEKRKTR